MIKNISSSGRQQFWLFRDLPCVSTNNYHVLFNFQKGQLAELCGSSNDDIRKGLQYLDDENFFDVKIALTPGEIRDQLDIVLNTTTACNMECRYCFLGSNSDKKSDLDKWTAIKFIDKMMEYSTKKNVYINFFGGEPTLNFPLLKQVTEYVNELREKQTQRTLHLSITTNGTMEKNLLTYLLKNDFYFSVSMDGLPSVQNFQRPLKNNKPSSKIVERNLIYIAQNTDKLRARITVTKESVSVMPSTVKYLAALGVKFIHFECVNIAGRATESHQKVKRPTADEFSEYFISALEIARTLGVSLINACYGKIFFPSTYMCEGISGHRVAISPSGFISHCLEVQDFDHPLAEIMVLGHVDFELKDICIPQDLRNQRFLQNKVLVKCKECFCRYMCSNGCPSRNYHITGSPFTVDDFYCLTTKSIIKHLLRRIYEETKNQGIHRRISHVTIWNIITPSEYRIAPNDAVNYNNILGVEIL